MNSIVTKVFLLVIGLLPYCVSAAEPSMFIGVNETADSSSRNLESGQHDIELVPDTIVKYDADRYYGRVEKGWVIIDGNKYILKRLSWASFFKKKPWSVILENGSKIKVGDYFFELAGYSTVYLSDYKINTINFNNLQIGVKIGSRSFDLIGHVDFDQEQRIKSAWRATSRELVVIGGQEFDIRNSSCVIRFDPLGNIYDMEAVSEFEGRTYKIGARNIRISPTKPLNVYYYKFNLNGSLNLARGSLGNSGQYLGVLIMNIQNTDLALGSVETTQRFGVMRLQLHLKSDIVILKSSTGNDVAIAPDRPFCVDAADKVVHCP